MIYFTADNHFYHSNIIGSCARPFSNVNEMNKTMLDNWNKLITKNDDVYILGDFSYKGKTHDVNEILSRLNGKKYLIKGNHENYLCDPLFNQRAFEWVKDYFILKYEGIDFILFHYPILSWLKSNYNSIHLYGHVHNSGIKNAKFAEKLKLLEPCAINVGVDVNNFYPVSIKNIIKRVNIAIKEKLSLSIIKGEENE